MPQKTRVGNDRSRSTTDVARRRNRNEKLYKAGDRSSVTLAAQNANRRAAVSENRIGAIDPLRTLGQAQSGRKGRYRLSEITAKCLDSICRSAHRNYEHCPFAWHLASWF